MIFHELKFLFLKLDILEVKLKSYVKIQEVNYNFQKHKVKFFLKKIETTGDIFVINLMFIRVLET